MTAVCCDGVLLGLTCGRRNCSRDQDTERRKFAGQDMGMIRIKYEKAKEDLDSLKAQVALVRRAAVEGLLAFSFFAALSTS